MAELSGNFLVDVERETEAARTRWAALDTRNTRNDYIAYATAYAGRAVENAYRNEGLDPYAMLVKAAGLLARAAECVATQKE